VRLQRWERISWLGTVADGVDGRLVQSGPATPAKDRLDFCVVTFGEDTGLAGAHRSPSVAECRFDRAALSFKFRIVVRLCCHRKRVGRRVCTSVIGQGGQRRHWPMAAMT
jgi:hypothetical protein